MRYLLQLTCQVSSPFNMFGDLVGVTKDISRTGMLVLLEGGTPSNKMSLVVGEVARIVLDLPTSRRFPAKCLDCMVKVVRVGPEPGPQHVAFEVRRMMFRDRHELPAEEHSFAETSGLGYLQ